MPMSNMRLYVKSLKQDLVEYTMPHHEHWCSAGYRSTQTLTSLTDEDREALNLIESLGVKCEVIDLAEAGISEKLKARFLGLNQTPTLVIGNKKIQGINNIRKQIQT